MSDPVEHPKHYTSHPSGVECITITEHMSFTLGNALKYIWRADSKGRALEDLKKARWYLDREIARREAATEKAVRSIIEKPCGDKCPRAPLQCSREPEHEGMHLARNGRGEPVWWS